ncbi:hypothetical protein LOTGIDRAFT_178022 [Lottia gigantea]|uniref:Uncharacterized protein n=1 Tax=Lottia gigantea TaxID=225164 RepID=V4A7S8_LOTGI|nr:hypothetical protein LOTGIDRAFT_178022 [Lottia gigantea]ESP00014.1 hypothetical protein LOTGIDRAFT_178022 [Lottia gigantea]
MLQPILNVLNTQRIVLASGSPRRKQFLGQIVGLSFEVIPSSFEENLDKSLFKQPSDYVKETARLKTIEVVDRLKTDQRIPDLVIGADTVVAMDDKIYEKPKDRQDAINMLKSFNNRSHSVYTGVVLATPKSSKYVTFGEVINDYRYNIFHECTEVIMSEIPDNVIEQYVDTGEPMDKAGGYGIQSLGGSLVKGINGDFFNVAGFPVHTFCKNLYSLYASNK